LPPTTLQFSQRREVSVKFIPRPRAANGESPTINILSRRSIISFVETIFTSSLPCVPILTLGEVLPPKFYIVPLFCGDVFTSSLPRVYRFTLRDDLSPNYTTVSRRRYSLLIYSLLQSLSTGESPTI